MAGNMGANLKHIVYVTYEFPPCGGGAVGRVHATVKLLAESGYKVTVITATENVFPVMDFTYPDSGPNVNIVRVYSPSIRKFCYRLNKLAPFLPLMEHTMLWQRLALIAARRQCKNEKVDCIISTFPPKVNHSIACSLSREFDVPWVAEYMDPPPWMYYEATGETQPDHSFARQASHLVVTTEQTKSLVKTNLGLSLTDISVIQNGCADEATRMEGSKQRREYFELIHTGSFYQEGRDITHLIKAASLSSEKMKVRFIGDPPNVEFQKFIDTLPDNGFLSFEPYVPYLEALEIAAKADVLLVIQGELFNNQIPGKVYEYLALQKTVLAITNKESATYHLLEQEPNVFLAEYGNVESILTMMDKALNHTPVDVDRSLYTRSSALAKYKEVLNMVL